MFIIYHYKTFGNFWGRFIQIKRNCKVAIDAFHGLIECPWHVIFVLESVKNIFSLVNNIELMWCLRDYNKAIKWGCICFQKWN